MTVFSWGYWGWGSSTRQLRDMVDAVEGARAFRPPVFVDIRLSRSVRATGFRDHAFEKLLGSKRYTWMRALGNRRIGTGRGGIEIADPKAVAHLMDVVIASAAERRRVVFFCACGSPRHEGKVRCHRDVVAQLLVRHARKFGKAMEVVEWPGGEPSELDLAIDSSALSALRRGRKAVPLPARGGVATVGALPLGSIVTLRAGPEAQPALVDRVSYRRGWFLELFGPVLPEDTVRMLQKDSKRLRRELGVLGRRS